MTNITQKDFIPGSAWDTWRKAGADHARGEGEFWALSVEDAAIRYAKSRCSPNSRITVKAFIEGYSAIAALASKENQ